MSHVSTIMSHAWQRTWEIVDKIAACSEQEREAALDRLCGGNAALHAEVRRLLDASAQQDRFERGIDHAKTMLASNWIRHSDRNHEAMIGQRVGAWNLTQEIGRGGMGIVFLAERADDEFEQRAAIKLLTLPTQRLLERFRQERRILARLEHPNIARLMDGGLTPTNLPYFVMEFVEGEKITDYCDRRRLAQRERLILFKQVCSAVQYAHEHLIVHRDLKPSNILVSRDGVPKLLDFGVATLLTDDDSTSDNAPNVFITPAYAAPEQLSGDAVTTATDVYALGAVLHELLTGTRLRPHDKRGAEASVADAEATHGIRLRGDLQRVVSKATAAEPAQRYSSVQALLDDVRNAQSHRPVTAMPGRWSYRTLKFARRHWFPVAAAALLAVTIIAGIAGIVWEAEKTHEQALHAASEARNASEQAKRARAVRDFTVKVLGQLKPDATQGNPLRAHELLDRALVQLHSEAEMPRAVTADIQNVLAGLYFDLGDDEQAERLLHEASTNEESLPPDVRARTKLGLAQTTWRRGSYPLAREYLHSSLDIAQSAESADETLISDIRHLIAAVEVDAHGARAEPEVRSALAYDQRIFGMSSQQAERDWETLGWVLMHARKFDEMEEAIRNALDIAHNRSGDRQTTVAHALEALSYARSANLDLQGAERNLREALEIDTALLGELHPDSLRVRWQFLSLLAEEGRFSEVLPLHLANLQKERDVLGEENSTVALTYTSVGETQRELGQFDEAEKTLARARAIWSTIDDVDDPEMSNVDTDLGSVFFLEGRYAEAESTLDHALTVARKFFPEHSLRVRRVLFWLAKTWTRQGQTLKAIALVTPVVDSLSERSDKTAADSYDLQYSLNVLGEAQLAGNQTSAGLASAQTAHNLGEKLFPNGGYKIGTSLMLMGVAALQEHRAADAEALFKQALIARLSVYTPRDPRLIEVRIALARALLAQEKIDATDATLESIATTLSGPRYPIESALLAEAATLRQGVEVRRKSAIILRTGP